MIRETLILLVILLTIHSNCTYQKSFNPFVQHSIQKDEARKFDPYADNGGTIVAIAGSDYCLVAADTRLSDSYTIKSRDQSRIFEVRTHLQKML